MISSNFNHLRIYNEGIALVSNIHMLCKHKKVFYEFAITSQLKRAVISIPLNIAEGYGRKTNKDFSQFLSIALGSCNEVVALLDCIHVISNIDVDNLKTDCMNLSKQIYSLRKKIM